MSEYISFFIRREQNNFIPLFTFSRNNSIYQVFRDIIPYEKVRAISYNELENKYRECERRMDNITKSINQIKEERALIASFNNSVDEKISALIDIAGQDKELRDELEEERRAGYTIVALIDIIESIRFNDALNKDKYIYAGIEVCDNITMEDVIE